MSEQFKLKSEIKNNHNLEMLRAFQAMAVGAGYERVDSMEALSLSVEELNQMKFIKKSSDAQFYRLQRADGSVVKVLIRANVASNNYSADIFSPAFFEGHTSSNDFSMNDLEINLNAAKE